MGIITIMNRFYCDESGATMVEYGILVALIAIAVATIVFLLGEQMKAVFNVVVTCIQSPNSTSCSLP